MFCWGISLLFVLLFKTAYIVIKKIQLSRWSSERRCCRCRRISRSSDKEFLDVVSHFLLVSTSHKEQVSVCLCTMPSMSCDDDSLAT